MISPTTCGRMLGALRASAAGGAHKCTCDLISGLGSLPATTHCASYRPQQRSSACGASMVQFCQQHAPVLGEARMLLCMQVTHAIRYPAPVLSLGLSPDCATLAVGMSSGLLSVKRHAKPPPAAIALAGVNHRTSQDFRLSSTKGLFVCKAAAHEDSTGGLMSKGMSSGHGHG